MFKLLIVLIFLSFGCLGEVPTSPPPLTEEVLLKTATPLLGMTAVDDFSSDIEEPNASEGGAMEMQRYFSTTVIAQIDNCLAKTQLVFNKWLTEHALIPTQQNQTENTLVLRIWDKEKKGLFEASYELNKAKSYVRTSLDYFEINGNKLQIETIKTISSTYHLAQLWTNLSAAIECD